MAIIISGSTKCDFCGAVIEDGQEATSFGHFVGNESDALAIFNDGAFHVECFLTHPLAEKAQQRSEEISQRFALGNRICVVCNKQITKPDDYFSIGHLTDDLAAPLYVYNYTQAHTSCLPKWVNIREVLKLLSELYLSGTWRGDTLKTVLVELEYATHESKNS